MSRRHPRLTGALDLARVAALRWGRLRRLERASRAEVLEHQKRRLARLLEHAWLQSPFHRGRWGGEAPSPEDLPGLQPLTRKDLNEHYDDVLTDRSVDHNALERMLGEGRGGSHVILGTSGTTGERVLIPYSRKEWIEGLAYSLRGERRRSTGILASLRRARRMATVMTRNPIHASSQIHSSFNLPSMRQLNLAAGSPLAAQIEELDRFQPTTLAGYPSAIDELARAQLEGGLAIQPLVVITGGETVSAGLRERVHAAWHSEIFDCYGLTETLVIAWECREHRGMHIDEDAVILEVVDDLDRVLQPGEKGSALLVTNLYNATLPIIRYRVDDVLRIDDAPCPCGVPFARITSIEGRRDEVLCLKGRSGAMVRVHPTLIESPLEAAPWIRRFQIHQNQGILDVSVEEKMPVNPSRANIEDILRKALEPHGVLPEAVRVEVVERIDERRGLTDKRPRIRRD